MEIRFAAIAEILALRQEVIIAGTDRDSPYFDGDNAEDTLHVAVFESGHCIACATLLKSEWQRKPAWQLRGMAVAPHRQGQGLGRALLEFIQDQMPRQSQTVGLWCNARVRAAAFYEKHGFTRVSKRFIVKGIGPHFRMFLPFDGVDVAETAHPSHDLAPRP